MRTSDKMIKSPLRDIMVDDFALRYVPAYSGVNSRSGLATFDPGLRYIRTAGWELDKKVMAVRIYTKLPIYNN